MKVKAINGFPSRIGNHRAGQEFEISRSDLEAAGALDLVEIIEDDEPVKVEVKEEAPLAHKEAPKGKTKSKK